MRPYALFCCLKPINFDMICFNFQVMFLFKSRSDHIVLTWNEHNPNIRLRRSSRFSVSFFSLWRSRTKNIHTSRLSLSLTPPSHSIYKDTSEKVQVEHFLPHHLFFNDEFLVQREQQGSGLFFDFLFFFLIEEKGEDGY